MRRLKTAFSTLAVYTEFNAVDKLLTTLADSVRPCIHPSLLCLTARINTKVFVPSVALILKQAECVCNEGSGSAAALIQRGVSLNW